MPDDEEFDSAVINQICIIELFQEPRERHAFTALAGKKKAFRLKNLAEHYTDCRLAAHITSSYGRSSTPSWSRIMHTRSTSHLSRTTPKLYAAVLE